MKLFYYDAYLDEGIESDEANKTNYNEAIVYFYNLTDEEGGFLGLTDNHNQSIQFLWISQDKWLVDIPIPPDFKNPQQYADHDECIEIIKKVYELDKVISFETMKIVDTMNETLDDVLRK